MLLLCIILSNFSSVVSDFVTEVMKKWPNTIGQGDDSGWTPLHIAAHMDNEGFLRLLLAYADSHANIKNREGLSALHIAAKEGNYVAMDTLMRLCPDMYELLDNKGRNALHAAAESGRFEAFEFLKARPEFEECNSTYEARPELRSLINEQDKEGNTPMHLAAINGHYKIVDKLEHCAGIQLNATNKEGFTKMDYFLLERELQDREPV